jgi:carbamoyl-phosphate synthase large subunit
MVKKFRVLITSAGRRGQLVNWFRNEVGAETFVVDSSDLAPAFYLADKSIKVPRIDSEEYIDTLIEICKKYEINIIIPTIDTELEVLSKNKDKFLSVGSNVLVSGLETIEISNNKHKTHNWLVSIGIKVPDQILISKGQTWPIRMLFPSIIKPISGSRSQGIRLVNKRMELRNFRSSQDVVIEKFISGDEYTVSTYVNLEGKCVVAVPRLRWEVRDGEVSKAVTRNFPEVEHTAWKVVEALPNAWGPINVQVIVDKFSGEVFVVELNARFGGGDPLAWRAGANMPAWAISEAMGTATGGRKNWTKDLTMLRFDDAVYLHWPQ